MSDTQLGEELRKLPYDTLYAEAQTVIHISLLFMREYSLLPTVLLKRGEWKLADSKMYSKNMYAIAGILKRFSTGMHNSNELVVCLVQYILFARSLSKSKRKLNIDNIGLEEHIIHSAESLVHRLQSKEG